MTRNAWEEQKCWLKASRSPDVVKDVAKVGSITDALSHSVLQLSGTDADSRETVDRLGSPQRKSPLHNIDRRSRHSVYG
jgi:hypothetical protein